MYTAVSLKDIKADDPEAIFLIDHQLTFKTDTLKKQLEENPAVVHRLALMMGLPATDDVDKVIENIWRYCNFYSLNAQQVENSLPLWYVNDELGSAVNHSDEANFRIIPFIHLPDQVTYSLLFPIKDVNEGDQVTRNYVENIEEDQQQLMMLPWRDIDFTDEPFEQHEPDSSYFLHGRIEESLPENLEKDFLCCQGKLNPKNLWNRISN